MKYIIGIDNGGTGIKVCVFDEKGYEIASHSEKTPLEVPKSGFNERDMELMWKITANCILMAIKKSNIDTDKIASVCCTGHGKGLYLWGKNGRPAYKGIASTDSRAQSIVDRWNADGTGEAAKKMSMQGLYVSQPVALLRWLKEEDPGVLENVQWIFEAKDYIRFMLTGEAYAEITDYSGTGMMNLKTADFDKELFSLFGIEEMMSKLPPIKYSCEECGTITKKASEDTGIPEGTPVCGGMFDIDACAIAMGANEDDDLCVITGTWAINEYVSTDLVEGHSLGNTYFCLPGKYLIDSSSPASAGNLDWYIDHFAKDTLKKDGKTDYKLINKMVESVAPGDSDIIFLPFLYGTNHEKVKKACFWGLDNSHSQAHLLRAIYEGVAFCHMNHIEWLLSVREEPKHIKLVGGVARSKVWTQIFADVTGYPIKIMEASELGGLGCAIAGAVSVGIYADMNEATKNMVRVKEVISPNKETHLLMKKKYEYYNNLIEALSGMK